jgi:4-amino-4-deoxy-L-arabinose transferase-like glycosyltransferase
MNRRWTAYTEHLILLALGVICYILFFHRLGDIGLIGPDEPRYSAVARTMLESGDYITPRLNGGAWFEKPPLMYWGAAAGFRIFGLNEWGARFPSALAATLCVFLVYWCARRLWNAGVGILTALIMASSVGFITFSRAASMDMVLTACLTGALVFFLAGVHAAGRSRRIFFYLFYASIGLGALAKGPVAFLLPAVSLFMFLALRGAWNEWRTWHPEGLLIAFGIALPWYVACTWANGYEFIRVFIINHNLERFASSIHGHQRPFYFYLPVLLLLTFPWTFLLVPAFRREFAANEQVMMWWIAVPLVFFSLSGSKLPGYILPVVPPIALLCAGELILPRSRSFKVAVFIEAGAMAFIGVGFGFFGPMIHVDPHVSGTLIAAVAFSAAAMLSLIALWLNPMVLAGFNVVLIGTLVVAATSLVFPRFDVTDTMRPWDRVLQQIVPASETVVMYRPSRSMEYGLQYYRSSHAVGVGTPGELAAIMHGKPVLCIAEDNAIDELVRMGDVDMKVVHSIGKQTAFWIWRTE